MSLAFSVILSKLHIIRKMILYDVKYNHNIKLARLDNIIYIRIQYLCVLYC